MRRALILAAALALGSACSSTYASEPATTSSTWPNGWTDSEIKTMSGALWESPNFAGLSLDIKECVVAGLITEFRPYQIRGELSPTVERKIIEIMEVC